MGCGRCQSAAMTMAAGGHSLDKMHLLTSRPGHVPLAGSGLPLLHQALIAYRSKERAV